MASCTYTNTLLGSIIIEKVTQPDLIFTSNLPGAASFALKDGAVRTVTGVAPGSLYTVRENAASPGYDLVDVSCFDTATGQVFQGDLIARSASFAPQAGHTIHCSFINEKRGQIVIEKAAEPAGARATFDFLTNAGTPSAFSLGNGAKREFLNVKPGQYTVEERVGNNNFRLAAITCIDSIGHAAASRGDVARRRATINLDAGETVTCRFLNVENDTIVVRKFTNPPGDSVTSFAFTTNLPGGNFALTDQATHVVQSVQPNRPYTVTQVNAPSGYDLTELECFDTLTGAVINGNLAKRNDPGHASF